MKKFLFYIFVALVIAIFAYSIRQGNDSLSFNQIKENITSDSSSSVNVDFDNNDLIAAKVVRVVDGDTIVVDINNEEKKVRLIGVDTPESVALDTSRNTEQGKTASNYTKKRLQGKTVYLQYDADKQDDYDRELCYVWLSNDVDVSNYSQIDKYMYNAELLINGYAKIMTISPNTTYSKYFKELQKEAKDSEINFWSANNYCTLENYGW